MSRYLVVLFSILVISGCSPLFYTHVNRRPHDVHPNAWKLALLVNSYRERKGLPELKWDTNLYPIALYHSQDMRTRNFFSHYNPDGESPFDRLKSIHIFYQSAAENLAVGQTSPTVVLSNWLRSPDHKGNLVSSMYTHHAVAFDSTANTWTHLFIRYSESEQLRDPFIVTIYFQRQ